MTRKSILIILFFILVSCLIPFGTHADPSPPTNLRINAVGVDWMHLAWDDNAVDETGFRIEQSSDGVVFSEVGTAAADIKAYLATGLTAETTYYYRVIAFNGDGDSGASNTDFAQTDSLWTAQDYDLNPDDGYSSERERIIAEKLGATYNTYYLDAVNGNDSWSGNLAEPNGDNTDGPWRTVDYTIDNVPDNSLVLMRSGKYDNFTHGHGSDIIDRSLPVVFMGEVGHNPLIPDLYILFNPPTIYNINMVFYGIKIAPDWVDPGPIDPQYLEATGNTYNNTAPAVNLSQSKGVEFYNCEMVGTNKHLTPDGIAIANCEDIVVEKCHIHKVAKAISYSESRNIQIRYNYVHEIVSTFFMEGPDGDEDEYRSDDILIEGNHAHDSSFSSTDDYCVRSPDSYHGSLVSIASENTIVRNNILHDGGNSSGIMFYSYAEFNCSNIAIENNLVYDAHNDTVLRINNLGENVIIRNNIFIGRGQYNNETNRKYNGVLAVHSLASGYNGSGLSLYNNIFVGRVHLGPVDGTNISQGNNILYALEDVNGEVSFLSGSIIAYPANSNYFENGFFSEPLDVSWPGWETGGLDEYDPLYPNPSAGYKDPANYTFAKKSPGINFGDPNPQYPIALAGIDENGFIIPEGIVRDANHHSAGCYEYMNSLSSGIVYLLLFGADN